jgi:hypothetical protein
MIEKLDDLFQVELVTNSYEKNESEPICFLKSDTDKSSKPNTLEFLDFFKFNHDRENREINLYGIKAYSRPISIKSSLNLSKELELKNTLDSKEVSCLKGENLLGDFEKKWQNIESNKDVHKFSNDNKTKSSKSSQINLRKNNYKEKKTVKVVRPNLAVKNINSIELPTDKDIDSIIKSLNHKKVALFEYNRQNQKGNFIRIKNESKSYIQSTKPSVNSLTSFSLEKSTKSKEKTKNVIENKQLPKDGLNRNVNIMSPQLKNKFIETLEDIIEKKESSHKLFNIKKGEQKIKNILDQYKDLNSVEKNFYSILKNINPNLIKENKNSFREKFYKKSQKSIEEKFKKNKNYYMFEKNFSMIDQISKYKNFKGNSTEKIFDSATISESSRELNKSFIFKKKKIFPESPRIKKHATTNLSSYEYYKSLNSKLRNNNLIIDKSSMINEYSSFNNIQN